VFSGAFPQFRHMGSNPGGHCFVFLNVSINKKPFFVSEVVTYETERKMCFELKKSSSLASDLSQTFFAKKCKSKKNRTTLPTIQ
jgi:hypothetical protein